MVSKVMELLAVKDDKCEGSFQMGTDWQLYL